MKAIQQFLRSEDGPTAVEYAVMLAMIVVVCVGAVRLLGSATAGSFQNSATEMENAFSGSGS